jgi:DNA-binding beta-propeller fold protein YncE
MRILLIAVLALALCAPVYAEVEWQVSQNLKLPSAPVDIATSADGQKVFVLLQGGELRIFNANGQQQEAVNLEISADKIAVSPDGGRLVLSDSKSKQVRLVSLDYIKPIDISGSPVKGPDDATVVVAVYSDFQ